MYVLCEYTNPKTPSRDVLRARSESKDRLDTRGYSVMFVICLADGSGS